MKRVSFSVAKAIKEAGYPQDKGEYYYSYTGHLFHEKEADDEETESLFFDASYDPFVLEVWLWLWREKKFEIVLDVCNDGLVSVDEYEIGMHSGYLYNDPEEAIEKAIEYLVDNDLIK